MGGMGVPGSMVVGVYQGAKPLENLENFIPELSRGPCVRRIREKSSHCLFWDQSLHPHAMQMQGGSMRAPQGVGHLPSCRSPVDTPIPLSPDLSLQANGGFPRAWPGPRKLVEGGFMVNYDRLPKPIGLYARLRKAEVQNVLELKARVLTDDDKHTLKKSWSPDGRRKAGDASWRD